MTTPTLQRPPPQQVKAADFRYQEALFAAVLIRDILRLWGQLDPAHIAASWPFVSRAIASLAAERFTQSAAAGAAFYEAMRILSLGEEGRGYTVIMPPVLGIRSIEEVLAITGPASLLKRLQGGQVLRTALDNTGVEMSGAIARLALAGARGVIAENVVHDAKALAWMRVLGPRPCGFCAMLASRGPVYKTQRSASFQAHNHCMCSAAPVFTSADVSALTNSQFYELWKKVTKGYAGKGAINAWRRYWRNRDESVPQPFEQFRGL